MKVTDKVSVDDACVYKLQESLLSGVFLLCDDGVFSSLSQLKCCGFTNYTDFVGSNFEKENGGSLPPSCCRTNIPPCSLGEAELSAVQVRWKTPLQFKTTMVQTQVHRYSRMLHLVFHITRGRNSCVKNERTELEREVQTLLAFSVLHSCQS